MGVMQVGKRHGETQGEHPVAKVVIRCLDCGYFRAGELLDEFQRGCDGEVVGE